MQRTSPALLCPFWGAGRGREASSSTSLFPGPPSQHGCWLDTPGAHSQLRQTGRRKGLRGASRSSLRSAGSCPCGGASPAPPPAGGSRQRRAWGPGGHRAEQEPAKGPRHKEGCCSVGLHWAKCCQQGKGGQVLRSEGKNGQWQRPPGQPWHLTKWLPGWPFLTTEWPPGSPHCPQMAAGGAPLSSWPGCPRRRAGHSWGLELVEEGVAEAGMEALGE